MKNELQHITINTRNRYAPSKPFESNLTEPKPFQRDVDEMLGCLQKSGTSELHFIDIENLIGAGIFGNKDVEVARSKYILATGAIPDSIFFIASGPQNRHALYSGWPGAVFMWRKGPQGADTLLCDFFFSINKLATFSRIYIGSGDGRLVAIADHAVINQVPVTVVSTKSRLSSKYRFHHTILLDHS